MTGATPQALGAAPPSRAMPLVLVIDDSDEIHKLLQGRLGGERLSLREALGGDDGIALARELRPDVILLDVDMPVRSGFSVCRELKADPVTQGIPVLFLSAMTSVNDKVRGLDLGAMDYITKPFDGAELRARLRSALRIKRYQDLLAHRAQIDALTGLWTRTFFDRRLREEMAAHGRHGHRVAVALVDIDHLRQINEGSGHPMGDVAVQTLGELLVGEVRDPDIVCRYNGGTFAIILRDADTAGAGAGAARILARVPSLTLPKARRGTQLTVSIGVAGSDLLGAAMISGADMVSAAERALYRAKREGGGRVALAEVGGRETGKRGP